MILGVALVLCTATFAKEGQWIEGYGQGNMEYFIDKDGYRLYIGCPTKAGSADAYSSVSVSKISDESDVQNFTVLVNGTTYDGPFETNCRVGDQNFIAFLEDIRKGNATVKFGKKAIVFPKSNAAKIVPKFGAKNFSCNTFF